MEPADTGLQRDREHLARDLHDLTITRLSWLSFELAAVATALPGRQVPNLIQAIAEVDDIIGDLRQFVLGSFNRGDDTSGLEPTLKHLAEYAEAWMGRAPQVELDGDHGNLPHTVATHTRAVLTEAVHNAVEHARATRLELQVRVSADQVEVSVADDGTGPPPGQAHGLGLGSMATRARPARHLRLPIQVSAGSRRRVVRARAPGQLADRPRPAASGPARGRLPRPPR